MASNLVTRANILSKSIPSYWLYPLATNLALFLIIFSSSSNLFLYTHLVPIIGWFLGLATSVYILFLSIDLALLA